MKKYVIYKHVFPDGSTYIGATSNHKKRWAKGSGYSYDKNLYKRILEFGWSNISHEILHENLNIEEAEILESREILKEKTQNPSCLNKRLGGNLLRVYSEKGLLKISECASNRKQSDSFRNMMKELHTGNSYKKGKKASEETINKMRISHMGSKAYNSKRILQYSLSMEFIKEWDCIMDIQREFGFLNSAIVANLKGKSKKSYGFIWRYKNEQ